MKLFADTKNDLQTVQTFCQSLAAAAYVVQWRGSHVWKVGGKVVAIGWQEDGPSFTFKVSDIAYEILKE